MKARTSTFRTKLWLYFALFAGVILSLLWILQTVGLQRFYNDMMKRNIRRAAQEIAANSQDDDLDDIIDDLSVSDSLLVYVTGENGQIYYSSDAYNPYFRQNGRQPGSRRIKYDDDDDHSGLFRGLPDDYDEFLKKLSESAAGTVEFTDDNSFVYGTKITLENGTPAILYTAGTLGAVGAAASIIRTQLLWVTVLSLVIAFLIAWLIARSFSKPVYQLADQARMLTEEHYEDRFQKGFCRELDDLDDSLNQTAAKLAEARNYQKELLANVSQDLRTPLTMIKGYAEMVRDISWEDETQRREDTGVIIREADRMTSLVNEILDYSQLRDGKLLPKFTKVDLSALTESVTDRFEPLFDRQGGSFERDIDPGCIVSGDTEQLRRVVFNLIDNAVRYSTGEDKRIRVTLRKRDRIRLEVRDHGVGMAPEELPRIWDKYYPARPRNGEGASGLGLAIVKQIAMLHKAEVHAESIPGEGASFTVLFDPAKDL